MLLTHLDFDPTYYFFTWLVVVGVVIEGGTLFFGHSKWLVVAEKSGFILLVIGLIGEVYAEKWIDYGTESAMDEKFARVEMLYKEFNALHPDRYIPSLNVCNVPFHPAPWPFATMTANAYQEACGLKLKQP